MRTRKRPNQLLKTCNVCANEYETTDDANGRRRKTCGTKTCIREFKLKNRDQEEFKERNRKISEKMKGKTFSEERKEEYKKKFSGAGNPRFGAELSEETRKKISEALLGKKPEKKYEKQCETCQQVFFTAIERTKFCNWRCNYRAKANKAGAMTAAQLAEKRESKRTSKQCPNCGLDFRPRVNHKKAIYCNQKCRVAAQQKDAKKSTIRTKNCKRCDKEFSYDGYREKLFCSRSCCTLFNNNVRDWETSNRKASATHKEAFASGKRIHPWIGRNHTEETKKKISEQHMGKCAGVLNPMYGKTHSPDACAKISEAVSKNNCIKPWLRNKTGYFESAKTGLTGIFRSSWEEIVFKYLETNQDVVTYKSEPFRIPYTLENKRKHYVPDFLVEFQDGRKLLLEIKPKGFLDYDINIAKFAAGRQYCGERGIAYEVWSDSKIHELIDLGL